MLRWGANANLARIHETLKHDETAEKYYSQPDPTAQRVGNLLRAREVVWRNPVLGP
jgi:hypothetical protein